MPTGIASRKTLSATSATSAHIDPLTIRRSHAHALMAAIVALDTPNGRVRFPRPARDLWLKMWWKCGPSACFCTWMSIAALARACGMSESACHKAMRFLVKHRLVMVVGRHTDPQDRRVPLSLIRMLRVPGGAWVVGDGSRPHGVLGATRQIDSYLSDVHAVAHRHGVPAARMPAWFWQRGGVSISLPPEVSETTPEIEISPSQKNKPSGRADAGEAPDAAPDPVRKHDESGPDPEPEDPTPLATELCMPLDTEGHRAPDASLSDQTAAFVATLALTTLRGARAVGSVVDLSDIANALQLVHRRSLEMHGLDIGRAEARTARIAPRVAEELREPAVRERLRAAMAGLGQQPQEAPSPKRSTPVAAPAQPEGLARVYSHPGVTPGPTRAERERAEQIRRDLAAEAESRPVDPGVGAGAEAARTLKEAVDDAGGGAAACFAAWHKHFGGPKSAAPTSTTDPVAAALARKLRAVRRGEREINPEAVRELDRAKGSLPAAE